jgi:hypothetical protein
MSFTLFEITKIHRTGSATKGRRYLCTENNTTYEGLENGRLRALEQNTVKSEREIVTNTEDISDIREDIENLQDQIDTLEQVKADKCFALAMSIIL